MAKSIVTRVFALKTSIEKKSASKSSKPTATQVANEGIKSIILEVLGSLAD